MSTRRCRSRVWKYFSKTGDDETAICLVCHRHLSYKSTIGNLGTHLKLKHINHYIAWKNGSYPPELESPNVPAKVIEKESKYERGRFWKYFNLHDADAKKAQCTLCENIISLSGSNKHLKSHLKSQHNSNYLELYGQRNKSDSADNSDDSNASNSSIKFSSEIWGYFEQVEDGSRCTVCEKTTENSVEEMRNHLEEEHPSILISILNNKEVDTDAEETFTEVVYLEEEKRTPKAPKRRKTYTTQPTEKTPQPEKTSPAKTPQPEKKSTNPESRPDIDTFLNYLGVLLRNVPKESMPKLQLDVVSCVLNAQMNPQKDCNCKETGSVTSHGQFQIIIDPSKIVETNIPHQ